jgi:hypothetical protein
MYCWRNVCIIIIKISNYAALGSCKYENKHVIISGFETVFYERTQQDAPA